MKWKVSMPLAKPAPEKVHAVLAIKGADMRLEVSGEFSRALVMQIYQMLIAENNAPKAGS